MARLLSSLLLALACLLSASLLPSTSAQSGTGWQLYSFCFTQQQTLATSPYLPWSVVTSGTLNVSTTLNSSFYTTSNPTTPGYPVTDARGTRTFINALGTQTSNIVTVAQPGTYAWNDNLILTSTPYFNSYHTLAFLLDRNATFAGGAASSQPSQLGAPYTAYANYSVSLRALGDGILELDNPGNDGDKVIITTTWSMTPATGGLVAAYTCPQTVAAISFDPVAVAAFKTTLTYVFCYQFAGGPGQGAYADGIWTDSASGYMYTTGWIGTTVSGRQGSLITSASASRYWAFADGGLNVYGTNGTQTSTLSLGGVNAARGAYPGILIASTGYMTNNVLFTTYPYVDVGGVMLVSSNSVEWWYQTNAGTPDIRLSTTATGILTEWFLESNLGGYYSNRDGQMIVTPLANYTTSGFASLLAFAGQCSYNYSTASTALATYSFCYYLDASTASTNPGIVSAYGVFTATGPATRAGRQGLLVQSMNGVRTVLNSATGVSTTQNIISLLFVEEDGTSTDSDNIIYTTAPYVDSAGLVLQLYQTAQFINVAGSTSDINLYLTNYAAVVAGTAAPIYGERQSNAAAGRTDSSAASSFSYALYSASNPQPLAACQAADSSVAAPPSITFYSFCYYWNSTTIAQGVQGVVGLYSSPIFNSTAADGRAGYAVSTMSGGRYFLSTSGQMSANTIVGPASNYLGKGQFYTASGLGAFDQLMYTSGPVLDSAGLLLQYAQGPVLAPYGPVADSPITRFSYTPTAGYVQEDTVNIYYNQTGNAIYYVYETQQNGSMQLINDGGASARAGSVTSQCAAPVTQTLYFCYTIVQSLADSPYMPWSVYVSGTITVNTMFSQGEYNSSAPLYGFSVVNITGTRTIQFQGQVITNNIIGVAPVNAVNYNDNIINFGVPFLDNSRHGVGFMLDGPAYFGGGATTGNVVVMDNFTTPLSLGTGMTEFGHPPNDGVTSIITSQFSLQWMNGQSWSCPYTAPLLVSPSVGFANALTQFKATQQWAFCWTHTGGPGGYSVYDGGNWTITSSGIITTTAYAGTTTTAGVGGARKGYLITNFTGTRTYTFENGTTQVIALVNVGAPGAAVWGNTINGARFIGSSESGYVANNILYATYPYFDSYGANVVGASTFNEEEIGAGGGNGNTNVVRIFTATNAGSTAYDLQEWLLDFVTGYVYYNHAGTNIVAPYTGQTISTFAQQCSSTYGTFALYSFCYSVDNSNLAATNAYRGISSAYGTFGAYGPVLRNGRLGLTVATMTGVRTVTKMSATANTTTVQNIIALKYPNQDLNSNPNGGSINDNVVWPTAPYLDRGGLLFTLSSNTVFPAYPQATSPDVWLFQSTNGQYYEYNGVAYYAQYQSLTPNFVFHYQAINASNPATFTDPYCSSINALVPAPPTTTVWSFCYYNPGGTTNTYDVSLTGTVTTFNQPILTPVGRTGYPLMAMTGLRQLSDSQGYNSVNTLAGLSSNYFGSANGYTTASSGFGVEFSDAPDQFVYTDGGSFVDQQGILYQLNGADVTVGSLNPLAPVARLFYDTVRPANAYVEETITSLNVTNGNLTAGGYVNLNGGKMMLVNDAGASAAAGTVGSTSCGEPAVKQFSFCYSVTNTLATSPWLSWTVTTSGWVNVSTLYTTGVFGLAAGRTTIAYGYQVVGMRGTRTIRYQDKTSTQNIIGVAPVNSYNFNDNVMNLAAPYFDRRSSSGGSGRHSVSFILDGPAAFADGPLQSNSPYVNINGYSSYPPSGSLVSESDLPQNDGTANILQAAFQLRFDMLGVNTCSLPAVNYTSPTQAQLTAYSSAGPSQLFCWSHTGGPGSAYGTTSGQYWQISTSGVFSTAGYLGTTADGRQGYKITGITQGTRVYQFENGTTQTVQLTAVGAVNAMANQTGFGVASAEVGSFGSYFYGNNVVYTSYPQLDSFGVVLVGAGIFDEELELGLSPEGYANSRVIRVLINPYANMLEYIWDPPTNYIWTNNGGYSQFTSPYSSQNVSAYAAQCSYQYGAYVPLSFCYWSASTSASNPWTEYTYGLMDSYGPVTREGRTAYQVRGMNGVRTFTRSNVSTVQNILYANFPNEDLGINTANTNLVFTTGAAIDPLGLNYALNPISSSGFASVLRYNGAYEIDRDINVWLDAPAPYGSGSGGAYAGLVEWSGNYSGNYVTESTNFGFNFSVYTPGNPVQACAGAPASIPAVPALQNFSFCYGGSTVYNGTAYTLGVSGTITIYGSPVSLNGRVGYPIMTMSGVRQFLWSGGSSSTPITGMSNDWIAQQQGWTMDQLFYPTAPYFSTTGALYRFSGRAQTTQGFITNDNVVKMVYRTGAASMTEEIYFANGQQLTDIVYTGMSFNYAADNGATAATILSTSCGVTFPGGGAGSSNSNNGGGGGGSGLSNGAIAGIVIGSVVGALLLCILCFLIILTARRNDKGSKPGTTTGAQYDTQTDMSKVSQVELANTGSEVSRVEPHHGEEHTEI